MSDTTDGVPVTAEVAVTSPEAIPEVRPPRPSHGSIVGRDPVLEHERWGRWRLGWVLLALVLGAALTFLTVGGAVVGLQTLAELRGEQAAFQTASSFERIEPGNGYTFAALVLVGIGFAVPVLILSRLHGRRWWFALGYDTPFLWRNFVKAASALFVLALIGTVYGYLRHPDAYSATEILASPPPKYAFWFGIGLLAVFVQSFGEELLFRGYLPRVLGAVFPYRLIVVGIVIAFFVSLHAGNSDIKIDLTFIMIVFIAAEILNFTILFRTRSIAATWGLHWVNNSFLFLLVGRDPGNASAMVPFLYTDPVWSAGGSYLYDPFAYMEFAAGFALLAIMLFWRHSPFYLPWHDEELEPGRF